MDFDRDFGLNAPFVDDLYQRFLQNPAGVDETWRRYFSALDGRPLESSGNGHGNGNGQAASQAAYSMPPIDAERLAEGLVQEEVDHLIEAYRIRGHLFANIDPLGMRAMPHAELELENFGLLPSDLDRVFATGDLTGPPASTLREIVEQLRRTYCGTIGVEYMHGEDPAIKRFLQERMESSGNTLPLSAAEKKRILERLTDAEVLESFLHKKYIGAKRFSLEGGEALIPLLDRLIEDAAERGVDEIVVGMAHRGRLNVLVNILQKHPGDLFAEFEDKDVEVMLGRGDVKYHLGQSSDRLTLSGKSVHLSMAFNPSHLEWVNTVVEGRVRAKQDRDDRDPERKKVLPLLIHGDAAFSGQGLVAECLNLANLEGYKTGGTIHVVINNQVGFTTSPEDARSTYYDTDIARMLRPPVFHVNGDDPEAVASVVRLAVDYRQTFQEDVLIDLYCYRKYGHNEADEPTFTQPLMYEVIHKKKTPREVYAARLADEGVLPLEGAQQLVEATYARLEQALEQTRSSGAKRNMSAMAGLWSVYRGGPDAKVPEVATAVPEEKLRKYLLAISQVPAGFTPHEKIEKLLEQRRRLAEGASDLHFDWATAEHLALASLLAEGTPVRFSGQDSRRGTFSQRHAVLADVKTGARHTPLRQLEGLDRLGRRARFDIFDSPLSEAGVLGFDYGVSLDWPDALVCWEAQFGDFVNAAQVVIDQFLSSCEDKWGRLSSLTMLLPHGFEGQGPEHSSARLERFLSLCAEDNMQVCNLTTPAQYFHVLRRQVVRPYRKPLIIMTPKSLLRAKGATSTLRDLAEGGFQRLLPDAAVQPDKVKRVLLCSGKVYYDLAAHRDAHQRTDVAVLRLEQLYPLQEADLAKALAPFPAGTEVVWVQEEPFNMGSWYYLSARWPKGVGERHPLRCVTRPESASPATGSAASHKFEQQLLVEQAFR